MKSAFRFLLLAAVAACFGLIPAFAGSSTYNTSNASSTTDTWSVSTPSVTAISSNVQATDYYGVGGGAYARVTDSNGTEVLYVAAGGPWTGSGPTTYYNSGSVTGLPAGNYTLTHLIGGPPNYIYGYLSTTFSW